MLFINLSVLHFCFDLSLPVGGSLNMWDMTLLFSAAHLCHAGRSFFVVFLYNHTVYKLDQPWLYITSRISVFVLYSTSFQAKWKIIQDTFYMEKKKLWHFADGEALLPVEEYLVEPPVISNMRHFHCLSTTCCHGNASRQNNLDM